MTHSWIESANEKGTDFQFANLPYCVFSSKDHTQRIGVRIGDAIVDLRKIAAEKLLPFHGELSQPVLNDVMALAKPQRVALRAEIQALLADQPSKLRDDSKLQSMAIFDANEVYYHLPATIGDFTDFYASIYHATNVGAMFRPENPLLPNYKHLPVGYHGRSSSVVISGSSIKLPAGQSSPGFGEEQPSFGSSQKLDYELELGTFVAVGNQLGMPVSLDQAEEQIFGFCLLNDWSARDIQKWEYQPLGPFLAKSFATSISPFVVTAEAMQPFRTKSFDRSDEPNLLPYLDSEANQSSGGIDIQLEVHIQTAKMRGSDQIPYKISSGNFKDMYWTVAQMLTHHTSNGCNLRPGDLLGSGTISGTKRTERGCLLERNWQGSLEDPVAGSNRILLELPTGEKRDFLADGDEVIFTAFAENEEVGRVGFGECRGIVMA